MTGGFHELYCMRLMMILILLFFASCQGTYYTLVLDDDRFRLRPGESIEKVKRSLSDHQYIYSSNNENESLQYYCTKCGKTVRLITLRFVHGKLTMIENREASSIY